MKKTEFLEYQAAGFNIIPVVRPVEMVDEDPITLFEKLRGQHNNFLLESVEGGERWAQFSILGFNCTDTIEVFDDTITITNDEGQQEMTSDGDVDGDCVVDGDGDGRMIRFVMG